ncbi:MAG: glycosyltransferase family 39 protein [Candidatus Auribacterota bacterium]
MKLTLHKILRWIVPALAGMFILTLLITVGLRMFYPYGLELIEGQTLIQTLRLLSGQPLYREPSIAFVPMIYTPLYTYLSAPLVILFGIGFFPLRLISVLATAGTLYIIYRFVKQETSSRCAGFVSSGLYAACYAVCGAWFDIARVDSLYIMLALTGVYFVRFHSSNRMYILAGVILALAIITKQTALICVAPLLIYIAVSKRARALYLIIPLVTVAGGSYFLLDRYYGGWLYFYTFWLPGQHDLLPDVIWKYWIYDIGGNLAIAVIVAGFGLYYMCRRPDRKCGFFYLFFLSGFLAAGWAGRLNSGGYLNALMPACAGIAVVFGIGYFSFLSLRNSKLIALFGILVTVQFALLSYNPVRYIPDRADREAGDYLVEQVRSFDGLVFIPMHPYLNILAGKPTMASWYCLGEFLGLYGRHIPKYYDKLVDEIRLAIARRQFEAVILDDPEYLPGFLFDDVLPRRYTLSKKLFAYPDVFKCRTGKPVRPEYLWIRK